VYAVFMTYSLPIAILVTVGLILCSVKVKIK
jgi:hypothetical protein